ncbi:hypothetical protein BHM03_00060007 [Ensete ventricosum]|nr:hypothetical protein BHM03_00060007 [Ensete ventricosum]
MGISYHRPFCLGRHSCIGSSPACGSAKLGDVGRWTRQDSERSTRERDDGGSEIHKEDPGCRAFGEQRGAKDPENPWSHEEEEEESCVRGRLFRSIYVTLAMAVEASDEGSGDLAFRFARSALSSGGRLHDYICSFSPVVNTSTSHRPPVWVSR